MLWDALANNLAHGQFYSYQQLNEIMKLDSRSIRGRTQFYRFAREVLTELSLHFECESNKGYRIVQANEQTRSAQRQLVFMRRRQAKGYRIAEHTDIDALAEFGPQALRHHADQMVRMGRLAEATGSILREIAIAETKFQRQKLLPERAPSPLLVAPNKESA